MRLIDADRAMEIVRDQGIAHPNAYHLTNYAMLILREAPTVEVVDVVEQCPECGNEVWLKWDVARDGYTIYCPYCGYRMKLCSMCDVRDGGKCDWNSKMGECKNDKI